jgi:hypothetical protein
MSKSSPKLDYFLNLLYRNFGDMNDSTFRTAVILRPAAQTGEAVAEVDGDRN